MCGRKCEGVNFKEREVEKGVGPCVLDPITCAANANCGESLSAHMPSSLVAKVLSPAPMSCSALTAPQWQA